MGFHLISRQLGASHWVCYLVGSEWRSDEALPQTCVEEIENCPFMYTVSMGDIGPLGYDGPSVKAQGVQFYEK